MAVIRYRLHIVFHNIIGRTDIFTAKDGGIALINQHKAPTAGINDAGLLKK